MTTPDEIAARLYHDEIARQLWPLPVRSATVDTVALDTTVVWHVAIAAERLAPLGYEFTGSGTHGCTFGVQRPRNHEPEHTRPRSTYEINQFSRARWP